MDFSLGGLGWLLGNQLMWNNLVPLGGELHQFRGNPHYRMRIEESAISFWLTYVSQFKMCQLCDLKRKFSICCLIMNSLSFLQLVLSALWLWHCLFVFTVFNATYRDLLACFSHLLLDIPDNKISLVICNYTNVLMMGLIYMCEWIVFIRPRAFFKAAVEIKWLHRLKKMTVIAVPTRSPDPRALFTPIRIHTHQ